MALFIKKNKYIQVSQMFGWENLKTKPEVPDELFSQARL